MTRRRHPRRAGRGARQLGLVWLRVGDDPIHSPRVRSYTTRWAAVEAYALTARELARWGQTLEASLHYAETREELAEYPDYTLSVGPRGGIRVDRA